MLRTLEGETCRVGDAVAPPLGLQLCAATPVTAVRNGTSHRDGASSAANAHPRVRPGLLLATGGGYWPGTHSRDAAEDGPAGGTSP